MKPQNHKDSLLACIEAIDELVWLIGFCPSSIYLEVHPLTGYSPGRHVRHCLDYFIALQTGQLTEVDYCLRRRDAICETDKAVALDELQQLRSFFTELQQTTIDLQAECLVRTDVLQSSDSIAIYRSSLAREFHFVASHTVHHLAYVSLMLRSCGIQVDRELGIAPSTASFRRQQKVSSCAP